MARRKRKATDSNVVTVSLFNGDNGAVWLAVGVLIGWLIARS